MRYYKKLFFIGFFIVVMSIASHVELDVSIALFNMKSPLGLLFESIGEWPAFFSGLLGAATMLLTRDATLSPFKNAMICIGYGLIMLPAAFMIVMDPWYYNFGMQLNAIFFVLVAAVFISSLYLMSKIDNHILVKLREIAMVAILIFFAASLVPNIIKPIWGRVRFREMVEPFELYTKWYLPQLSKFKGIIKDPTSFPSAHTSNASAIFIITLLPKTIEFMKSKKLFFYFTSVSWTFLVALSRIIMGAHFLTDVIFGGTVTCLMIYYAWKYRHVML